MFCNARVESDLGCIAWRCSLARVSSSDTTLNHTRAHGHLLGRIDQTLDNDPLNNFISYC